jgi:hypothetical protein
VCIPLHRLGPHEFHFEGSPLQPWNASNYVDLGLTPPDDDDPRTPSASNAGQDEEDDAEMKKRSFEDDKQDESIEDYCQSGGETDPPTNDMSQEFDAEDDQDTYESQQDTDLDNYLRFKIIPLFYRQKGNSSIKKSWTQNARRRYQLRRVNGEDSDLR